ncbi:hypothetical protein HDV05_003283 [Chytridiales sp. JEL 0842]|nr:hypothetical protein HDV05_003283 [Chytridiales sp. JEL 0842]
MLTEALLPNGNPAWSVEYDYVTDTFRPLTLKTNIFCGGGTLLPDGRMMVTGGAENFTDLGGILNGERRLRILESSGSVSESAAGPARFGTADWWDDPDEPLLSLKDERWYPTSLTLPTGHIFNLGGSVGGVEFVYPENNTPTFELLPPTKDTSTMIQFLWDTLPGNLYPFAAILPSGRMFVQASDRATLLDPKRGYETLDTFQIVTPQPPTGVTLPPLPPTNSSSASNSSTPNNPNNVYCLGTSTPPSTTPPSETSTVPLQVLRCTPYSSMNQNVSAVSEQTFAFLSSGISKFDTAIHRTGVFAERGEGVVYHTGSKGCLQATGDGGVGLTRCVDGERGQVWRWESGRGRLVSVGTGECLGVGDSTRPLSLSPCSETSQQAFRFETTPLYFEFPKLPGGPWRSYPWTGAGILLPLDPYDNYEPSVLVCGGSINNQPPYVSSNTVPAQKSCGLIYPERPDADWITGPDVDMPTPRVMGDMLHLPDGTLLNLNGAQLGMAGWDMGRSPNLEAELFLPRNPRGSQWQRLNSTTIPRMYHSSALLLPDGRVLVAGSAPNSPTDRNWPSMYKDEHRVEYFHPPYLTANAPRPSFRAVSVVEEVGYNQTFTVSVSTFGKESCALEFSLIQPGFRTHSTGHNQRLVWLRARGMEGVVPGGKAGDWAVVSPPTAEVAPPGYYMLFAVCDGIPSEAVWIQIGGDPAGIASYFKKP